MGADPTTVGERLLGMRERFRSPALSELADALPWDELPEFVDTHTIAVEAHRKYHDELQARAAQGDHHARNILLGLTNDDPGGS
jgi:hypothetical protein